MLRDMETGRDWMEGRLLRWHVSSFLIRADHYLLRISAEHDTALLRERPRGGGWLAARTHGSSMDSLVDLQGFRRSKS